jgi:anti-sigma regulatory factor (Ser/Thr protein kinase)
MMRRQFSKTIGSLDDIFAFLELFSQEERLDAGASYILALAVEEFFTNIVKYGQGSDDTVDIDLSRSDKTATVCLEERTPVPFDVTRPTETQFEVPFAERRPGGLGIHIAKEMLDGVFYDYRQGISRITLVKHLET